VYTRYFVNYDVFTGQESPLQSVDCMFVHDNHITSSEPLRDNSNDTSRVRHLHETPI